MLAFSALPRHARVLAIASSTGGPAALTELVCALPPLGVPIVVAQHMPPDFTRLLAERLAVAGSRPCAEARHGEPLRPGHIYVAPGDHHLRVERHGRDDVRVRVSRDARVQHCRPAADVLFTSVAAAYGADAVALVLTGMGHDGRDGAAALVRAGGRVLVQDEASSVVWGMPGAVARAGLAAAVLPIPQLAAHVAASCAPDPGPARPAGR